MAELSDIEYIKSNVQFTSISDVSEINAYNRIKVTWNFNVYDPLDIISLTVMRAVLDPGEKANLGNTEVVKKFKTILTWTRTDDTAGSAPPTELTDQFKWNDNSDGGIHNLNYANDLNWTEKKFRQTIRRICAGEQGVMYKIFGYSRRMSRGATPLGFFCDTKNLVALSQKNQMIKDHWYGECQQVWATSSKSNGEFFVRVAVDMTRDLSKQTNKERRVWASTNKGNVYCFDYWTGKIIGTVKVNTSTAPVYALSYSPLINRCVAGYSNGTSTYVVLIWEDNGAIKSKTIEFSGGCSNDRITGGICTVERTAGGASVTSYFYMIYNKEFVIKYRIISTNAVLTKRIGRDHFGILNHDLSKTTGGKEYKAKHILNNQDNIYGIGGGINGQVWVNGHTPLTVYSLVKYSYEEPTGKIRIMVKVGNGNGNGRGCAHANNSNHSKAASEICNKQVARDFYSGNGAWADELLGSNGCPNFVNKHWGSDSGGWEDSNNHWVQCAWNYSANLGGESRDAKRGKRDNYHGGCAVGFRSTAGIKQLNWYLEGNGGPNWDKRVAGEKGKKITLDMVSNLPKGGPDNDDSYHIHLIHQKVRYISSEMRTVCAERGTETSLMQDLNFIYGCTDYENYNDTNGQFETTAHAIAYRSLLSGYAASGNPAWSKNMFNTMTNWASAEYAMNQYGYAGRANVFDKEHTTGKETYPYRYDNEGISARDNWLLSMDMLVGKPYDGVIYDTPLFEKKPASAAVLPPSSRNNIFHRKIFTDRDEITGTLDAYTFGHSLEAKGADQASALPMSIGSLYGRLPKDGRMYVDKVLSDAYYTSKDKTRNGFSYEVLFADRREGKIGFLKYTRQQAATTADVSNITAGSNRRLKYANNADYEYYPDRGINNSKEFIDRAPYHVVVDSDNNVWECAPSGITKMQFLTSAHGLGDKYVFNRSNGTGLCVYENENTIKEVCIALLNKHATNGAKYGTLYNTRGISNGEGPNDQQEFARDWTSGHNLITTSAQFNLEKNDSDNKAYFYNYSEWRKKSTDTTGCWTAEKIFNTDHYIWRRAYLRSSDSEKQLTHIDSDGNIDYTKLIKGNQNNEYNSDNFGVNCLIQKNEVELGPDIIHPIIKDPSAKSKIIKSVSRSNNDICDTQDGSAFWDARTLIFNNDQSTSGYDNLDTTHLIYDIVPNYRHLVQHRYNYNDYSKNDLEGYFDVYNGKRSDSPRMVELIRDHNFEYDENTGELVNLDNVKDNFYNGVWYNPNYWGLVPPYGTLTQLRNNQYNKRPLFVNLYLDYTPSVYNVYDNNKYESLQVGHHEIHLFERWPTADFCLRAQGSDQYTDIRTGVNNLGGAYWQNCLNDGDAPSECSGNTQTDSQSSQEVSSSSIKKKKKTTRRKKQ